MKQVLKQGIFRVTLNQAFEEVILNCATTARKGQDGTWITTEMQQAYLNLHQNGYAHSVEVWQDDKLVGGLYGLKINRFFAAKACLVMLAMLQKRL
ncbi:Leucyl/phenylalanyl-tRNA--protein transferase [compost metagenome]